MIASSVLSLSDLTRQKRFETDLSDDVTPRHTVGQAVEHYLDRMAIPDNGLRWMAFSRGRRLDNKSLLEQLPDSDTQWTVLPEVSAGASS
jgi:hypothetical protein